MLDKKPFILCLFALATISCGRTVMLDQGGDAAIGRADAPTPPPRWDGAGPPPPFDGALPPPPFDGALPPPPFDGALPPPPFDGALPPPPFDGALPPPPPVGPDLIVEGLRAIVGGNNGLRVRYEMRICNRGVKPSGASEATIYFHRQTRPRLFDVGDEVISLPSINPGACTNRRTWGEMQAGIYSSWAQVDFDNAIVEVDERNNVFGPVQVTVGGAGQDLPDLTFASFTASVSGNTVTYRATLCNRGQANANQARIDFFYHSFLPPVNSTASDGAMMFGPLAPGACTTVSRQRTNTPDGTYISWARLDMLGSIIESDENNNLSPAVRVTVGPPPPLSCTSVCAVSLVCGLFPPTQFSACLSWCNPLGDVARTCLSDAARSNDCAKLETCAPLPPPPPPPPPGVCDNICQWFVGSCNILPGIDTAVCLSFCESLSPAGITCAQNAQAQNNCQAALGCLL